jgi:hypothetical protein
MLPQPVKFLFLSGLGLSLFLGNSAAFAQSGNVVVPTEPVGGTRDTTTTTIPTSTTTSTTTTTNSDTRFSCQYYNSQYTVMYQPETQPGQYFAWANPRTLGGGWDTQKRCVAIAQRLETYRPQGLTELLVGQQNGYNILCVTTEANPSCQIVLTVPPEKDPYVIRDSVFQNLLAADNGEQTVGVNTFTGRGRGVEEIYNLGRTVLGGKKPVSSSQKGISLKPFLDARDGGTGNRLRNGVTLGRQPSVSKPQTNKRLNPDQFR